MDRLMEVFEVYETNGNKVLIFLDEDKANKQNILSGDKPYRCKVYLSESELIEIRDNGFMFT